MVCENMKFISSVDQDISRVSKENEWDALVSTRNNFIFPSIYEFMYQNIALLPHKIEQWTLMRFMMIDTCEMIDFTGGRNIIKTLYFI